MNDFRFALRQFVRHPSFTALVVLTLGLAIGANTAVFSVVNAVLLRPLPFHQPDQLVVVWQEYPTRASTRSSFSLPNFADLRAGAALLTHAGAYALSAHTLQGVERPERLNSVRVSASFLGTLGVKPALGRDFEGGDDRGESARVALLSDALWRRQFHSDPQVIDRSIRLNEESVRVIGVLPPRFRIGEERPDVLLPLRLNVEKVGRGQRGLTVVARIKSGTTRPELAASLQPVAAQLRAADPWANADLQLQAEPLQDFLVGPVRRSLLVLSGAVACVLFIACANVANLALVRLASRQGELTIRAAIGASRWRIGRQLLTESLMTSCLGGVLGFVAAYWRVSLCRQMLASKLPQAAEISLDSTVLAYTFAASVMSGLLAGALPALSSWRSHLAASLKDGARAATAGRQGLRYRQMLVATEVGLAFTLLVGAGLLLRSLGRLQQVHLGFDEQRLLTVQTWLSGSRYNDNDPVRRSTVREVIKRLEAIPGVEAVTFGSSMPLADEMDLSGVALAGKDLAANEYPMVFMRGVAPNFFQALRVPLLEGRHLGAADNESSQGVVVINATMARQYWPDQSAVGQQLRPDLFQDKRWRLIVGVVADIKNASVAQTPRPEVYYPYQQVPTRGLSILLRTAGSPLSLSGIVEKEIWTCDSNLAIAPPRLLQTAAAESFSATTFQALFLATFAALALLLALTGIYGILSFSVSQRTRELGIRLSLGAETRQVYRHVLSGGLQPVLVGIGLGMLTSSFLVRSLSGMLFEVKPTDAITLLGVTALLLVGAAGACFLPARRAALVDPAVALRSE